MTISTPLNKPDKVLTPEVLDDFEAIRALVCTHLQNTKVREKMIALFREIPNPQEDTISHVLSEISDLLTPEIPLSIESQLFFRQRQDKTGKMSDGEISSETFINLQELLNAAIMDVFFLVCLYTNSSINKQKLKWILHLNMQYGWETFINLLLKQNLFLMRDSDWTKIYNMLRSNIPIYPQEKIDTSMIGRKTKDYIAQTICPFRYNEKKWVFIDDLWEFFEIEIIPIIKERFKTSKNIYEMFISWNLGNKAIKDPSK